MNLISLTPDHVGICYLCRSPIIYGTKSAFVIEGHGESSRFRHEFCEKLFRPRRLIDMLWITGSLRKA